MEGLKEQKLLQEEIRNLQALVESARMREQMQAEGLWRQVEDQLVRGVVLLERKGVLARSLVEEEEAYYRTAATLPFPSLPQVPPNAYLFEQRRPEC